MTLKDFVKELNGVKEEGQLIPTVVYSLVTSFLIIGIGYYFRFRYIDDFMSKYGYFLFFAVLSYALLFPTVRQIRAHKSFSCMSGMMIGMTIGMMAGFLSGFFVGATNGMFVGGFFGVLVGSLFGIWLGSCCGVMGFLEGIMAGFMGGLMGAMTAVMMISDNLKLAGLFIFIICSVILIGLNYMVYSETTERERKRNEDHFLTIILTFILTFVTLWLMIYGPRSALFGG